jgi:FtsH-binding integral membrane protein
MARNEAYWDYIEERGEVTMSARAYIVAISLLILGGVCLAAIAATVTYGWKLSGLGVLAYFAVALPGVLIPIFAKDWRVSMLGYLMVISATGAIMGPFVKMFELYSVVNAAVVTGTLVACIGTAGAIYPKSVAHWGGWLLAGLLFLVAAGFSQLLLGAFGWKSEGLNTALDWFGIGLFCVLVFYDMNLGMRMPYNMNNAVFVAVGVYLDLINIFVRYLARTGKVVADTASVAGEAAAEVAGSIGDAL